MSQEERILRLENAMSTLAELAADQHRLSAEQQQLTAEQQRLLADQQRRTARLEESFVMLIELTRSHDEAIDELKAARVESEQKFATLADAMKILAEAQKQLAESQTHSDRRLDALIDIVRQWGNGRG
jgi:hypothetical protein